MTPWYKNPTFVKYVLDPLERAGSTFVQQFVVIIVGTGSVAVVGFQAWGHAANYSGFAALISIGTSILTFSFPEFNPLADLAFRVIKTAFQSFMGVLIGGAVLSVTGADWKGALAVAIPVAVAALLKGLAALAVPQLRGASVIPANFTTVRTAA
jgi:hypothetical protein